MSQRYSLTVTAFDPNPAYDAETEARKQRYGQFDNEPRQCSELSRSVLTVDLTEAEWIAVKRAVLEAKL